MRRSTSFISVASAFVLASVGAFVIGGNRAHSVDYYEAAPAGYASLSDAEAATDATLLVRITSAPTAYVDFGADGKPDFPGQKGIPEELVTARVDKVLRGDPNLVGTEILLYQPAAPDSAVSGELGSAADRYVRGRPYLVLVSSMVANPGVGAPGSIIWTAPGWGFGSFAVDAAGGVSAQVAGVYPETFGPGKGHAVDVAVFKTDGTPASARP
jgi:hypothetical protein